MDRFIIKILSGFYCIFSFCEYFIQYENAFLENLSGLHQKLLMNHSTLLQNSSGSQITRYLRVANVMIMLAERRGRGGSNHNNNNNNNAPSLTDNNDCDMLVSVFICNVFIFVLQYRYFYYPSANLLSVTNMSRVSCCLC